MTERQFINKGHYFILLQQGGWLEHRDVATGEVIGRECVGWSKTQLIVTNSAMKSAGGADYGLQLIRFYGDSEEGPWKLASNPYAGVYLTPGEWSQVFKSYGIEGETP